MILKKILTTASFFILFLMSIVAQVSLEKSINFQANDLSISDALFKLASEHDLNIAYSNNFFSKDKRISIDVEDTPISKVLNQILKDTDVAFKQKHQQVILHINRLADRKKYTISGYVQSESDHEKLIGVNIHHRASGKWTTTNAYGFYSLTLSEKDSLDLVYSYLGCGEKLERVAFRQSFQKIVNLRVEKILEEVVVIPEMEKHEMGTAASNGELMPPNYLAITPSVGGEDDIIALAKSMPGVESGADGFGGVYVRGGDAGQNLMLLDGVPIYNPSHLLGIFSVYNSKAIRSARLLKGQFPARYGGRVSSVFDVRSKEGNQKEWASEIGFGLISTQALVEGPIAKKKGGILIAGRRTHSNFLLDNVFKNTLLGDTDNYNFNFYDLNAKIHYDISEKDRLYLSYYRGRDSFNGADSISGFDYSQKVINLLLWGNDIAALRWNKIWGNRLFSNTTLTYSRYNYQNTSLQEIAFENDEGMLEEFNLFQDLRTQIRDWSIKIDFDYHPNPRHYVKFGLDHIRHEFTPYANQVETDDLLFIDENSLTFTDFTNFYEKQSFPSNEYAGYLEDEFKWTDKLTLNAGLRFSAFDQQGDYFFNLEPRFNLCYKVYSKLTLNFSVSKMNQYLQQVSVSGLSLPGDIWLPATKNSPPLQSWIGEIGANTKISKYLNLSLEVYYKKMDNLLSAIIDKNSVGFGFGSSGDELEIEGLIVGKGKSYGLEVMLQKTGKTGGWVSATYSNANRTFEDSNRGRTYAFQFDRRLSVNAFSYHQFNSHWNVSLNWVYGTGSPEINLENEFGSNLGQPISVVNSQGNKNKRRNKSYHRLDFNIGYNTTFKKTTHTFKFGAYNVYNRSNVAFSRHQFEFDNNGNPQFEKKPVTLLYFTPSLYYQIQF